MDDNKTLKIGCSASGKSDALRKLINHQQGVGKIYLHADYPNEPKK